MAVCGCVVHFLEWMQLLVVLELHLELVRLGLELGLGCSFWITGMGRMPIPQPMRRTGTGKTRLAPSALRLTEPIEIIATCCNGLICRAFSATAKFFVTTVVLLAWYVMVKALHSRLERLWFDFRPFHFQVTTLRKLFTHMPLSPSSINWYRSKDNDAV